MGRMTVEEEGVEKGLERDKGVGVGGVARGRSLRCKVYFARDNQSVIGHVASNLLASTFSLGDVCAACRPQPRQ